MRQIKFRGKCIKSGEWVYGDLCRPIMLGNVTTSIWCDLDIVPVDPFTVGQFTGLLDRNGKEIYEGDVVDVISFFTIPRDKEMGRTRAVIGFDKDQASFFAKGRRIRFAMTCANNMEIIGNIHDEKGVRNG